MFQKSFSVGLVVGLMMLLPSSSRAWKTDTISSLAEMNVSGPRVGFFGVLDTGILYKELIKNNGGRVISQFGWHFEIKFVPIGGGPAFLLELIPLIGGVEYGMFIPSISLPVGIRLPFGTEFGMGPSFAIGNSQHPITSSIVVAAGHSFSYKGVGMPVNIVYARGPAGHRLGMLVGYAITKNVRKDVQQIPK